MVFSGIPEAAFDFYERLEADNTKVFWHANKATFDAAVRRPMAELCEALADYGPFHLFRPNHDLRFAKGRPPYKTHQGAYGESDGGAGHYLHISAEGLMCGTGYYAMAKDQLERFRAAVLDDAAGPEIESIVTTLATMFNVGAIDELKTAPKGIARDHPRITLLRRKGLMVSKDFGKPAWVHTSRVVKRIRDAWTVAREMNAWLDRHVGPSTLPPDDRRFG